MPDPVKDPLYPWKKHSGFKKGLLTDIVLGDEHSAKTQYTTTMVADFKQQVLENDGKTAGRFSGFIISDKGQKHIMFGDMKMQENDRLDSVSKVTFKPPQIEKKELEQNPEKSIRDKYHAKLPTATSAAHFGSQTRQDLPIDDHHFTLRNFNTTTNDSYRLVPPIDSNRVIYGPKRSQLSFGDLGRAHNYDTVHHTSFVKHETEPIKLKKLEQHRSAIFNSKNYPNESQSLYITTASDNYKGAQLSKPEKNVLNTMVNQRSGASSIQFGQSKDKVKSTESSVTKRDYGIHPTHHVVLRNPSSIRSDGIQKAMQPSDEPFSDSAHHNELAEESAIDISEYEPAGISLTKGLQVVKNQSSVPEGDLRYYNTSITKTTSAEDFIQYPHQMRVVANGPSEVPTKYRIFNHDVDTRTTYQTTSKTEYTEYSKEDAKLVRGAPFKPSPLSNHKLGDEAINIGGFKSTQHSHFCAPVNPSRRVPQLPQLALPNCLFPLAAKKNPTAYQTSFADYFPAMTA